MGIYRKIEVKLWSDRKFRVLSPMKPSGQGLFLFLMTAPQTCQIPGLFRAGKEALAGELGWSTKALVKAFRELEDHGMAKADFDAKLVWLPNALKHNKPVSPNVIRSWKEQLEILPECNLLDEALEAMRVYILSLGFGYAQAFESLFCEPSGEPSGKTFPNQEQDQEQEKKNGQPSLAERLPQSAEFSQRLEKLKGRYNDLKIGPPFRKTVVNLNPSETSDLMNIMSVYQDDISLKAMENYSKVIHSPEYDPGGCTYKGFISFMIRGVEKYCDEARPFEIFKKKLLLNSRSPPNQERHYDISMPKESI